MKSSNDVLVGVKVC